MIPYKCNLQVKEASSKKFKELIKMNFMLEIVSTGKVVQESENQQFVTLDADKTQFNVREFQGDYVLTPKKVFHQDYFLIMIEQFVDSIKTQEMFGKGYPIEGEELFDLAVEEKYMYVHTGGNNARLGVAKTSEIPEPTTIWEDVFERVMMMMMN